MCVCMLQSNHISFSGITFPDPSKGVKTPDQSSVSNKNQAIEAKIRIEREETEREREEEEEKKEK